MRRGDAFWFDCAADKEESNEIVDFVAALTMACTIIWHPAVKAVHLARFK
jgi:hypothetical protein